MTLLPHRDDLCLLVTCCLSALFVNTHLLPCMLGLDLYQLWPFLIFPIHVEAYPGPFHGLLQNLVHQETAWECKLLYRQFLQSTATTFAITNISILRSQ